MDGRILQHVKSGVFYGVFLDFHLILFSRKILNELSSPVAVSKIEEESNSSQSQDGDSPEGTSNLSGVQYQQGSCKWTNYSQLQYYSKFLSKHQDLIFYIGWKLQEAHLGEFYFFDRYKLYAF